MRTLSCSIGLALVSLAAAALAQPQPRADFIIITDPSIYTIFNQYQQPLSGDEQRSFLPGAPLQVVEKQVTLGDQISRALKFMYRGESGYLLMDEKGAFAGETKRSNRQAQNQCEVLGDTVLMLKDGMRITTLGSKTVVPGKGERLYRVFRVNGRFYVLTIDAVSPVYGWCTLEPKTAWKKSASASPAATGSDTLLPQALRNRLQKRIDEANRSCEELFSHFNRLTGDEKSIPRWQTTATPVSITFTLSSPWRSTDELTASTRYLQRDLETMLLGSGFWLIAGQGTLAIKRNDQGKEEIKEVKR